MTLTAYDPNDTGEILADGGLAPAVTETARITYDDLDDPAEPIVGEGTRRMPRFLADAPISPLPLDCVPRHANTDDQWLVPAVLTGAEATVLRTAIPPQPGQPNPHPPTGPTNPPPGPPPPVATDEKPPPTMPTPDPPKPSWTGEARELPTVRPAVPRVRTDRDPGRRRAGVGWPSVAALAVGLTVLIELALVGVSALLGVQW